MWRRWAQEFVDELHRHELPGKVIWKMNCRADVVERELFLKMRDAGLYLVYMGLESGSEEGLKTLHKQMTVEQNLRAVDTLKSIDLMWEYGFMLLDPSSTFESVRENLAFLRRIVGDGCLPVTFCRMLPYDGTPIKDELVRTGRLRGDVCNPDYDFLDPRLEAFYEGLTSVVNVRGWIHGLEAVTLQLSTAWHEVAVMGRLFPSLPGFEEYTQTLRRITSDSNRLLLNVVEDLSYTYSDGRENPLERRRGGSVAQGDPRGVHRRTRRLRRPPRGDAARGARPAARAGRLAKLRLRPPTEDQSAQLRYRQRCVAPLRGPRYIVFPVSSSDFRSLRIQDQPPAPCSENLLATIPAMIGAPSSSWVTVSLEKPAVVFSISHVTRVKPSAFISSLNRKR